VGWLFGLLLLRNNEAGNHSVVVLEQRYGLE
jgi:hypothetical protein